MATFPSLPPSARTYTPGSYPHTPYTSMSGQQSRVRHSSIELGATLELTFIRLSAANRQSIENHYRNQFGDFLPFHLSPQVFSGFTPLEIDPYGLWRYAEPPDIEDHAGPTATVQVRLVSVPGGAPGTQLGPVTLAVATAGAGPAGALLTIADTITPGAATAS